MSHLFIPFDSMIDQKFATRASTGHYHSETISGNWHGPYGSSWAEFSPTRGPSIPPRRHGLSFSSPKGGKKTLRCYRGGTSEPSHHRPPPPWRSAASTRGGNPWSSFPALSRHPRTRPFLLPRRRTTTKMPPVPPPLRPPTPARGRNRRSSGKSATASSRLTGRPRLVGSR